MYNRSYDEKFKKIIDYCHNDEFNPDGTKFTIFIKKTTSKDTKPDIDATKLDFILLINKLNCKNNVKNHLLTIYNKFGDSIFGRGDIIEATLSSKSQASIYIKLLKDGNLIKPISGCRKGKYKFK